MKTITTIPWDILLGHIEIQKRDIYGPGWTSAEYRRLEYDIHGLLILTTEWEETGTRLTFPEYAADRTWWQKLLGID